MSVLSMEQAAEAVGLSYERFRKVWPQLVAGEAMPAPFSGRRWDGEALAAWKQARSSRAVAPAPRRPAPDIPIPARAERGRRQLQDIRRAG